MKSKSKSVKIDKRSKEEKSAALTEEGKRVLSDITGNFAVSLGDPNVKVAV